MSYNSVAQHEDAVSEADYSELVASPIEEYREPPSQTMSANFDQPSPHFVHPSTRTVSRDGSGPIECPTPDLQSLQGAYLSNVERLEQSAERLSMHSDIGEEIRKIREEQKSSDSRRSSIFNLKSEEGSASPRLRRQPSHGHGSHASNSILGTNSVARSGGFSSAGYFASSRGSVRSGSWSQHNSVKGRSASREPRLTQVAEPEKEGKPLDSPMSTRFAPVSDAPESPSRGLRIVNERQYNLDDVLIPHLESPEPELEDDEPLAAEEELVRNSTDTARQVDGLFMDFDGVHTVSQPPDPSLETPEEVPPIRRRSTHMLNTRPQSYLDPMPGENMVYYPAPVPMMLNLPKRLSKLPDSLQRDKRRSAMLDHLPIDAQNSAAWLPGSSEDPEKHALSLDHNAPPTKERKRRTVASMPPQLRASMFFDYPSTQQDIEVKGESAVATLDSILDASAFAPVSAFTDHPIVGQMGAEVYGRAPAKPRRSNEAGDGRRRSSTINLLANGNSNGDLLADTKKRNSLMSIGNYFGKRKSSGQQIDVAAESYQDDSAGLNGRSTPLRGSLDHQQNGDGYIEAQEEYQEDEPETEENVQQLDNQPTTLLAELQMRKQQQKTRNRTAATAFPQGMHATLLQLDAVAQVQQKTRKGKHTALAWEDPDAQYAGRDNEDDEDVPLGVLYPAQKLKSHHFDENRPLGLIARRQMEDSEPLSHRRARLRGEELPTRGYRSVQQDTTAFQDFTNLTDGTREEDKEDEHPGETLAQRIKRLKATQIPTKARPVSNDFASEIMTQLGGLSPNEQLQPEPKSNKPTRDTAKTPPLEVEESLGQRRKRLQTEAASKCRNTSDETAGNDDVRPSLPQRRSMADILQAHPAAGAGGIRSVSNDLQYAPAPKTRNTSWAMQVNEQAGLGKIKADGAPNRLPHPMIAGRHRQVSESEEGLRKGDMIDRWRQSVLY